MKSCVSLRALLFGMALCLSAGGSGAAAGGRAPAPPALELGSPVTPGRGELADSAFRKLAVGKDYLTRDDTLGLEGFAKIFSGADRDHDGRLDWKEFEPAWKAYGAGGAVPVR